MTQTTKPRQTQPEVQVVAKPKRRRFTAKYKRRILAQADACTKPGEVSALLRREGLYSSHLSSWRQARELGELAALEPNKRGPKSKTDPRDQKIAELEKQLAKERARRERAEALVEVQKKGIDARGTRQGRGAMIDIVNRLGVESTCAALGLSRATYYRKRYGELHGPKRPRPKPSRALSGQERQAVLDTLHEQRFVDQAPAEVYGRLLDEGKHLCSVRTMYRILTDNDEVRERRNQRVHPPNATPRLCARAPNQVWTWDITKLLGPRKWTYFYLYVVLDLFSRYVVGWLIAEAESAGLAQRLITETCARQEIEPKVLTLHQDRGSPMTSKTFAQTCADLGVTKSFSRPRVSNDNPFSESHFKTLKYRPEYPGRFDDLAAAESHCRDFFSWYNHEHLHSGLGLMTPHDIHHGLAEERQEARARALAAAFAAHPERFPNGPPTPPSLPTEIWINQPSNKTIDTHASPAAGH
ncbi:IS3 family transposase [Plesiocystis pacifica]